MKNNCFLTEREKKLIELYGQCSLGMSPNKFYRKWPVTHAQIAFICDRSTATVSSWFSRGRYHRRPTKVDLRHLALMDFILEHDDERLAEILNLLCPPPRKE